MAERDREKRGKQAEQPANEDALDKRGRELGEIRDFIDETTFESSQQETTGELNSRDQHPADFADFTFQRELHETVRRIVDIEEDQVRHAQERKQEGTYGICERCGGQIDPERLEARPEATLCIDCQREREREFGSRRR